MDKTKLKRFYIRSILQIEYCMKKSHWFFLICLVSNGHYLNAQEYMTAYDVKYSKETIYSFDNRYSGVKGSPYIFDDWIPAKVSIQNNQSKKPYSVSDVSVMIDAHKNVLFVQPLKGSSVITMDRGVQSVLLYQGTDSLLINLIKIEDNFAFCSIIFNGKIEVAKSYKRIFKKANYKEAYSTGKTYDEFIVKDQLYLNNNGKWIKIKNNKKFWTGQFPTLKHEITTYFKANNVSDESSMLQFLKEVIG